MKFMLNGAVTLGTYDGANVEIVEQAGKENNYIFGARVEELGQIEAVYDPKMVYEAYPRIRRVVDTLVDGTFSDGGTGMFQELYDSLLKGASWHKPDNYYLLLDFLPYCDAKLQANADYRERPHGFYPQMFDQHRKCGEILQRPHHPGICQRDLAGGRVTSLDSKAVFPAKSDEIKNREL